MSVDRNLLSEFAKITNDTQANTQTQLYGTVVTQGDKKYVKMDGSDIITPIISTTDIKDGERVMVSINNHIATVTGNITNPSAGNDRVSYTEGKVDEFDHLFAGNITAGNIAANSITSDKILAGSITTDKLMAESIIADKIAADAIESKHIKADAIESKHIKADAIESDHIQSNTINSNHINSNTINSDHIQSNTIKSEHIDSNTIKSNHIQSNSIDSIHINSNSINSDHIQSNTIKSEHIDSNTIKSEHISSGTITADKIATGTITADKIATGTITAGSGVIADGAIGNAQISSLDVAKLESGTIDTSKIYIAGADGHLQLKGNRLQVFDGLGDRAVERVSVGDVNGDGSKFGLRVRGADGETILLDENGVTSEGITDGSITNNKISDDANIDGAKLNINSVVTEINDNGTEVIKGTKISVNGTNLETKLSTIETKQTTQGNTISQHSSKISANEKAISLKVDNQTYTTDKQNMTTQLNKNTSSIEALKGEISLKVEQTDITNAINNIQVGGRNFILNSNFIFGVEYWRYLDGVIDYQNKKCAYQTMNTTSGETFIASTRIYNEQISGKTITLSFLAACTPNMRSFEVYILSKKTDSGKDWDYAPSKQFVLNEKLTKYTWTYTMPSDIESFYIRFDNNASTDGQNATLYITDVKFEIGNKATDWTPAPEDVTSDIDSKVSAAKSEIKITTDAITQNVSNLNKTVSTKADGSTVSTLSNKVGSLETSVNGISGKVSSLETTTTSIDSKVKTAQNTADSAKTTATTANNTANANKNNITNLQGEVSTVKNNVASLEVTTSGISQKVSSVESTTATLSGKVNTANNNATNALNKANSANTLADSKAKVFTSTPTVPYKVGDLWVQGTNGDVMKCKTARASGSYTASDWEKASKYTDDTKANAVDGKVTTLQGTVNKTNSKVATIETNLNGITQRVSSTESTTATLTTKVNNAQNTADNVSSKLNNLQIGARNLLKGTSSELKSVTFGGWDYYFPNNLTSWKVGGQLTGRVYIKPTNQDTSCMLHVRYTDSTYSQYRGNIIKAGTEGYSTVTITVNPPSGKTVSHIQFSIRHSASNTPSDVVYYKEAKVESGSKATDWSPAPEDVDGAINSVDSKVNTLRTEYNSTNSKVASLETNLNGITSRVGTVETNQTKVNGKVSSLETRMSTAESKITESAITNTVKKNFYTKDDINNKGYQTSSQVQQTVNGLEVKVKQSGGYNNLFNSGFKKSTSYWSEQLYGTATNKSISTWNDSNQYILPNTKALVIRATNLTDRYGVHQNVKVKEGATYSISALSAGHRNTKQLITIRKASDGAHIAKIEANPILGGKNINNWRKMEGVFTIPSGCTEITVCLYMVGTGNNSDAYVWYTNVLLSEGKIVNEWSPHPSEIYDGVTTIDKDGVTVTASNVKSKTNMSANGFKITKTDTNEDVFKVNADGTLYMKGQITVTGGSIPTANLSGTISSNQLNSSITTDITNAKNNASTALSTANTAKTTADSAKSTATTANNTANTAKTTADSAKSTATTANNTANSVKSTIDNNSPNWSNAYNRVKEWASGAVTGSTTINGGKIATNTILANKLALGDLNNYAELNEYTYSSYGFTKVTDSSASNNPWFQMSTLKRDTTISKTYTCKGGETFRVTANIYSTAKASSSSSDTSLVDYRVVRICIYSRNADGTRNYQGGAHAINNTVNASATITLPSTARSFYVAIQIDGWAPFSGTVRVRNVEVKQMSNGELIVDGSITASKIAANTITGDKIAAGTISSTKLTVGDFTNLCKLHTDNSTNGYTVITHSDGFKYFRFGSTSTAGYYSIQFFSSATDNFRVGDKFRIKYKGWCSAGSATIVLRVTYTDNTWHNFGSVSSAMSTTNSEKAITLEITSGFNANKVIKHVTCFIETNNVTGYFYMRDIVITRLSTELYDGITSIDKNGITVKQSNISTYTTMDASSFRVENNTGGTVAEFSQNSQIPNLTAGIITANNVHANNLVTKTSWGRSYYVHGGTGVDASGRGTSWSNPFRTVQYVLDNYVEDVINHDITIFIKGSVQYWDCNGRSGKGTLWFYLEDDCIVSGGVGLNSCSNHIRVTGSDNKKGTLLNGIVVTNCPSFDVGWLTFRGKNWASSQGSCNILVRIGSRGIVRKNDFNGVTFAVIVDNNSECWFYSNQGSNVQHYIGLGAYSKVNLKRSDTDSCPDYTGYLYADAGHVNLYYIRDGANFTKTPSIGWSPSYTPTQKTQTWSFNNIWSDETLRGWSDRQELIQGYSSTWNTGRWTGYIQMSDSMAGIRNTISGGTNLSGRIYIQRTSSSGNSTGSKLCLYGSDGTLITNSTSINRGQGVWVSLSSSIIQKIQSGAIKYFYLKADADNKSTYFKCERNCKIEITYTK